MGVTTDDQPGPRVEEEVQFEDRTSDGDPTVNGAVRLIGNDLRVKTAAGVKSLTASASGALPPATDPGQVLVSIDGATFSVEDPIFDEHGWTVNDDGVLIVEG